MWNIAGFHFFNSIFFLSRVISHFFAVLHFWDGFQPARTFFHVSSEFSLAGPFVFKNVSRRLKNIQAPK